jgi:hypothetical protein
MKTPRTLLTLTAAVLAFGGSAVVGRALTQPVLAGQSAGQNDFEPDLKKKIVPIVTVGSSINLGVAQVQGGEADVNKVKAVAQFEQDYKNVARIKLLVPIQSEKVLQHIDRVPGTSVSAVADYAIKK